MVKAHEHDGTPIDAVEQQLWNELREVTGSMVVSVVVARGGRSARITALNAAIVGAREERGIGRKRRGPR